MPRILIIEDDPLISRMYQQAFEFEKFEVGVANNGIVGIQELKKKTPTLILLDIMMPKMSGIEFIKRMKASEKYKNIPVVVLTNLSGTKDAEEAISLGAVKFIVKSKYKPKEVVKEVKQILAGYTRDSIPNSVE